MCNTEELCEPLIFRRNGDDMDMIRHQTVRPYANS